MKKHYSKLERDSGEILHYIYQHFKKDKKEQPLSRADVVRETGWDEEKMLRIVRFLNNASLIRSVLGFSSVFSISGLTNEGIETMRNMGEFKKIFGFDLAPGSFSWKN